MRSKERTPFTPVDLCGLIAHETASMLYGVGADSIPSAETMRAGLETFAAAAGAVTSASIWRGSTASWKAHGSLSAQVRTPSICWTRTG